MASQFSGHTAEQILEANDLYGHASHHFRQCARWLDYLLRKQNPCVVHYAAIELRYGIELLMAELLVVTGKLISESDYQNAIGNEFGRNKKELSDAKAKYEKLAYFTDRVFARHSSVRFCKWDLNKLARCWGVASEHLHFMGSHDRTYKRADWLIAAHKALKEALDYPLVQVTTTQGAAIMPVDQMAPEIRQAWDDFANGRLAESDLDLRLDLIDPALRFRKGF